MKNLPIIIIALLLVISCSTQKTAIDYDRSFNFSAIKTYELAIDSSNVNEFDAERISIALQENLKTKGIVKANEGNIIIKITSQEHIVEKQNSNIGVGIGGGNRGFGTNVGIGIPIRTQKLNQNYQIVFYKQPQNTMVWQGVLELSMPVNASPELRNINITKGIQKLFKNYPPNG